MKSLSKQCYFCTANIKTVDHKDGAGLREFTDPQARILPSRRTGVCSLHQRKLARAIKRARIMGLLPFLTRST